MVESTKLTVNDRLIQISKNLTKANNTNNSLVKKEDLDCCTKLENIAKKSNIIGNALLEIKTNFLEIKNSLGDQSEKTVNNVDGQNQEAFASLDDTSAANTIDHMNADGMF